MTKQLCWDKEKCLLCGGCLAVCPPGNVLMIKGEVLEIDQKKCIACGKCVKTCPMGALVLEDSSGER